MAKMTNFRTYEAQCRLLAAVIATSNCKLDYKEIARHVGGGASEAGLEHRFRPIKKLARLQEECVREGKDPIVLPVEGKEIQKLFGESTAAGIEFQFREVKALGKAQRALADSGGDPATVPVGSKASRSISAASTPRGPRTASTTTTPRGSGAGSARGPKRPAPAQTPTTKGEDGTSKRRRAALNYDDSGDDSEAQDYDTLDTPKLKLGAKRSKLNDVVHKISDAGNNATSIFGNGIPEGGVIVPFGEGRINTAFDQAPPPSYFGSDSGNLSYSAILEDDEIMEIDGSQFSNKSQNSQNITQAKQPASDKDPFAYDTNNDATEFLDLTVHGDELLDGEI